MKNFIWISVITFLSLSNAEEERPFVSLEDGLVRGTLRTSYDGRTFSAFEGIPYAKPPVGNLRFKDPEPTTGWSGELEATTTHTCLQISMIDSNVIGEEDCLYLNVYVPRKEIDPNENLDVLVHFHGGAYMIGNPHESAGPYKLMDRDLVYVNVNYRLGPLGFLSFGDNVIPGNYGMKDQTFALLWVKNNIQEFGGNPNSVTINGGSAGGSSTHLHYFSPISKGLFHRGIAGNGVALTPWAIKKDPYTSSQILAKELGCSSESTEVILRCMQEISAIELQESIKEQYIDLESLVPLVLFGPVIESQSPTAFLSTDPYEQFEEETVTDVPLISIMTTGEGTVPAGFFLLKLDVLNENIDTYFPILFEYDNLSENSQKEITDKILEHYFNNETISYANFDKFIKLGSDRLFHGGAKKSMELHAASLKSNAYLILHNYAGQVTPGMEILGVGHCADMRFYYDNGSPGTPFNDEEIQMKNQFLDLITNFAKTGIPTIEGVDIEPVSEDDTLKYLLINNPNEIEMTTSDSFGNLAFWNSLGL